MPAKLPMETLVNFNTIHDLRLELPSALPQEATQDLEVKLSGILDDVDHENELQPAVIIAMKTIGGQKPALQRFKALKNSQFIGPAEGVRIEISYQSPAGNQLFINPGALYECPVAECKYRRFLMAKGDKLVCKEHHVDLVPYGRK